MPTGLLASTPPFADASRMGDGEGNESGKPEHVLLGVDLCSPHSKVTFY